MSLKDYEVARDKFELGDGVGLSLAFPCCMCKHRNQRVTDEPCRTCDHNACAVDGESSNAEDGR